jgi:thioredoxin-like negative regulator of GroEL
MVTSRDFSPLFGLLLLLGVGCASPFGVKHHTSAVRAVEARAHPTDHKSIYEYGVALYQAEDYRQAADVFKLLYMQQREDELLQNLAACHLRMAAQEPSPRILRLSHAAQAYDYLDRLVNRRGDRDAALLGERHAALTLKRKLESDFRPLPPEQPRR